jgi:hypothetical protein
VLLSLRFGHNTFWLPNFDELYDLEADPYEMHNLALNPAHADVLRQMAEQMWQRIHKVDPHAIE